MPRRQKKPVGFSLLEIIAVITVMGIIAAIVVPRLTGSTQKGKANGCYEFRKQINKAVESYYCETSSLPIDLDELEDPDDFPKGIPRNCPLDSSAYTLHPVTKRVVGHVY